MWKGVTGETRLEDLLGERLSVRSHHVLAQVLGCTTIRDTSELSDDRLRTAGAGRVVLRDLNDLLAACGLPLKHWSGDASEFALPFDERSVAYLIVDEDLRELLSALGFAKVRDLRERPADWRRGLENASESWEDDCRTIEMELKRVGFPS